MFGDEIKAKGAAEGIFGFGGKEGIRGTGEEIIRKLQNYF